ncbi:hypothetical protein [Mycoplasma leonicaptivi]|uniref:hypothetical protein n=1 Tax=Mycoplasma leonicaptivi TaxID=36742 RepID=UPI0004823421|nr:hypothetical protein [Mycoplasma leonicaptivi]
MKDKHFLETMQSAFCWNLLYRRKITEKLNHINLFLINSLLPKLGDEYQYHCSDYADEKELNVKGEFYSKKVEVGISKNKKPVCVIQPKIIFSNYNEENKNYFDTVLSDTLNFRSADIPVFQILVLLEDLPSFSKYNEYVSWKKITKKSVDNVIKLTNKSNIENPYVPNKFLLYILDTGPKKDVEHKEDYAFEYINDLNLKPSSLEIEENKNLIYNNYEKFEQEIIKTLTKK